MEAKNITLKDAANKLKINYSTAKTIVQTFRKERRILKKPRFAIKTVKAIKHQKLIIKALTKPKIKRIIRSIIKSEILFKTKEKNIGKINLPEGATMNTAQTIENPISKRFHRIESAGQMILFESEISGPKCGQITRSVSTIDLPKALRSIFYIKNDPDEEYERLISENDKAKTIIKKEEKSKSLTEFLKGFQSSFTVLTTEVKAVIFSASP